MACLAIEGDIAFIFNRKVMRVHMLHLIYFEPKFLEYPLRPHIIRYEIPLENLQQHTFEKAQNHHL